jgi:hypothetical protein
VPADAAIPPTAALALPLPNAPSALRISLPPEPVVEWLHHGEPSWMMFRLDNGPEQESWDVLHTDGEAADSRLREA